MTWMDEVFRFLLTARKPDGSLDECQLDTDRNLKVTIVSTAIPAPPPSIWDDPGGLLSERIVSATPKKLMQLFGFSQSYGFLHVFDAATAPADGAVPSISLPVWGFGSPFALPLSDRGRAFGSGIVWVFSSTPDTLTRDPSAQLWTNAELLPL